MWTVAGLLLGFVVIATLLGFHVGPHSHLVAGVFGVLAAAWLLVMAANGYAQPLLWIALGADVAVSAGFGSAAIRGLHSERIAEHVRLASRIIGAEGVADTELDPEGIVRVQGETWSATSLNGRVPKGSKVQVVEAKGLRLAVWGEETGAALASPFEMKDDDVTGELPGEQRAGTT